MTIYDIMKEDEYESLIETIDRKSDVIRSHVQQVCMGDVCAMFLWGKPGRGKSHIVLNELDVMVKNKWRHHKGMTSPKGIFLVFQEDPTFVHCFEDCEDMYKHQIGSNLLRCACGEESDRDRIIPWKTQNEDFKVRFTGGVIIISNEDMRKTKGPLAAVASRCKPVQWSLTKRELICLMLKISQKGWKGKKGTLTPVQCIQVAEYLITQMTEDTHGLDVDLRMFCEHCLPAFAWWLRSDKKVDWKDIIKSKLQGEIPTPQTRDEKSQYHQRIASEIDLLKIPIFKKHELWKEKTGLGKSIYHRHLSRAKQQGE
jgi:hypothetical protein